MKSYRDKRKQEYIDHLGGKCVSCSTKDNLEFDHIDPSKVNFRIGGNIMTTREKAYKELELCQLLCHDCHWDKTREENGYNNSEHGTVNRYNNLSCRCDDCRIAWNSYLNDKNYYRDREPARGKRTNKTVYVRRHNDLTDDEVEEINELYGTMPVRQIAKKFKAQQIAIRRVAVYDR